MGADRKLAEDRLNSSIEESRVLYVKLIVTGVRRGAYQRSGLEVRHWTKELGVSEERLRQVVQQEPSVRAL